MSHGQWMIKQAAVISTMEYHSTIKKEVVIDKSNNLVDTQRALGWKKKSDLKGTQIKQLYFHNIFKTIKDEEYISVRRGLTW